MVKVLRNTVSVMAPSWSGELMLIAALHDATISTRAMSEKGIVKSNQNYVGSDKAVSRYLLRFTGASSEDLITGSVERRNTAKTILSTGGTDSLGQ